MIRYYVTRLLSAVPVLIGISILAFILGILSPGDPAEIVLNQDGLNDPSEEQIAAMQEQLGLNKPVWLQYINWSWKILHGNLGISYITGRDIADELLNRFPVTFEIAVLALIFAGTGGVLGGMLCAVNQNKLIDNCLKNVINIMLAIPSFWVSLVLILIFGEILHWLPVNGDESLGHLLMPALILSFPTMATVCRYMRGAMLEEFGKPYFLVCRVRGIKKYVLLFYYALPNAVIPVIALLGNYFANVLGGSVIIENIFSIQGISSMALDAIRHRDFPVLQAYVLFSGCLLVIVTTIVDTLVFYFNPKINIGG